MNEYSPTSAPETTPAPEAVPAPAPTPAPAPAPAPTKRMLAWSISVAVALFVMFCIAAVLFFWEQPTIADGTEPVTVGSESAVSVTPAAGWRVLGEGTGQVTLTSPDGALQVLLSTPERGRPAEVVAAAAKQTPPVYTEPLRSGYTVAQAAVEGGLLVAVGDDERSALMRVSTASAARAPAATAPAANTPAANTEAHLDTLARYRPALIELLDTLKLK